MMIGILFVVVCSSQGLSLPLDDDKEPVRPPRHSTKAILDLERQLKQEAGENKHFEPEQLKLSPQDAELLQQLAATEHELPDLNSAERGPSDEATVDRDEGPDEVPPEEPDEALSKGAAEKPEEALTEEATAGAAAEGVAEVDAVPGQMSLLEEAVAKQPQIPPDGPPLKEDVPEKKKDDPAVDMGEAKYKVVSVKKSSELPQTPPDASYADMDDAPAEYDVAPESKQSSLSADKQFTVLLYNFLQNYPEMGQLLGATPEMMEKYALMLENEESLVDEQRDEGDVNGEESQEVEDQVDESKEEQNGDHEHSDEDSENEDELEDELRHQYSINAQGDNLEEQLQQQYPDYAKHGDELEHEIRRQYPKYTRERIQDYQGDRTAHVVSKKQGYETPEEYRQWMEAMNEGQKRANRQDSYDRPRLIM